MALFLPDPPSAKKKSEKSAIQGNIRLWPKGENKVFIKREKTPTIYLLLVKARSLNLEKSLRLQYIGTLKWSDFKYLPDLSVCQINTMITIVHHIVFSWAANEENLIFLI